MIEVGEYVRSISGEIDKVDAVLDNHKSTIHLERHKWQAIKNIVKHSKNLIDLIEPGDYVNGNIVYEVLDDEIELLSGKIRRKRIDFTTAPLIDEYEIKTIVTKQQIEAMEYKVEE